jgi:hypothetical protein
MIGTLKLTQDLEAAGMARPQAEKASTALKDNLSDATVSKAEFDAGLRLLRADLDGGLGLLRAELDAGLRSLRSDMEAAVARLTRRLDTHDKLLWFIAAGIVALFARSFFP